MFAARHRFPRVGYSDLKNQITSAAESIVFTIVEGCGASSQPDFARYLEMSIKSSKELEGELEVAKDYGIVPPAEHSRLNADTIETRRMLFGLRKRVLESDD